MSQAVTTFVEPTVDLKPGARILLLKNIDTRNEAKKEQPLVNGTTGRILRWATADEAEAALKAREESVWKFNIASRDRVDGV